MSEKFTVTLEGVTGVNRQFSHSQTDLLTPESVVYIIDELNILASAGSRWSRRGCGREVVFLGAT